MDSDDVISFSRPAQIDRAQSVLEQVERDGAIKMRQAALVAEAHASRTLSMTMANGWSSRTASNRNETSSRAWVRCRSRSRECVLEVASESSRAAFFRPSCAERSASMLLLPVLYLKGVSTGDLSESLAGILGPNAAGLSAANTVRRKEGWKAGVRRMVEARPQRQALRVYLSRRPILQRKARQRPTMHSGSHARHRRRQEGAHYGIGWPSRKRNLW